MDEFEAEVTGAVDAQSSIELTKGVKGEYGWKLKVYVRNDELLALPERLRELNAAMKERFS